MAVVAGEFRTAKEMPVTFAVGIGSAALSRPAVARFRHPGRLLLDEGERGRDVRDALPGHVVEIAGLQDLGHGIADVLGQFLLMAALKGG